MHVQGVTHSVFNVNPIFNVCFYPTLRRDVIVRRAADKSGDFRFDST